MTKLRLGGSPQFDPYKDLGKEQPGEAHDFVQREVKEYNGLKIKPKKKDENKPKSERLIKEEAKERMNIIAERIVEDRSNRNQRMLKLVKDTIAQLNDKTLLRNKSPIAKSIEDDTRKDLINLVIETNNDELEEMADMGSTAVINLLVKLLMTTRDRINEIDYNNNRLIENQNKEISQLREALKKQSSSEGSSL